MGERRRAREYALQMLFQLDLSGGLPGEVLAGFWEQQEVAPDTAAFAERLVRGVAREQSELDRWIGGVAEHWRLERMAVVDRNVLRIAIYELLREPETPAAVVIDEAIEVARKFGSEGSASFINALIDSVRRRIEDGSGVPPQRDPVAS